MTNARVAPQKFVTRPSRNRAHILTVREQMLKDEQHRLAVASRIRELRGAAPQPVIAEKVGVGLRGYQKWEATGGISWENLQKLAKVHGVDADWILKGEQPKGNTPDLSAAMNGNQPTLASLDKKLDELLAQVDVLAHLVEDLSEDAEEPGQASESSSG